MYRKKDSAVCDGIVTARHLLLLVIRLYQRYVSPYKGFSCAYRCHTGHASCSVLGFRAIRRYGVLRGLAVLRARTVLCGGVHRRFAAAARRPPVSQRGDCDLGCELLGDCNLPQGRSCSKIGEFAFDCCSCDGCDWPKKDRGRRKRDAREQYVYIPPQSGLGSRRDW